MKSFIFYLFLLIITSNFVFGQKKNSYGQNIKMYKADRVIISANYLKWQDLPSEMDLRGVNRGFYLGYFIDNPIGSSRISFAFGGSITSNNLYSDALPTYLVDANCTQSVFIKIEDICQATEEFKLNKMTFNYIGIPIEWRLRLGKNEFWKLSLGFDIGYLMTSYLKYEGNNVFLKTNENLKVKLYNLHDVNYLRYGVSARIGYNRFGFRFYYPLSTVFDVSQTQLFPIEIGLSLMVF